MSDDPLTIPDALDVDGTLEAATLPDALLVTGAGGPGAGADAPPTVPDSPGDRIDAVGRTGLGWTYPDRLPEALASRFASHEPLGWEHTGAQAFPFRAVDSDGTTVVVRVARPGMTIDHDAVSNLVSLDCRSLARLIESDTVDGVDYQIMEYVEGPTLASWLQLRQGHRLGEDETTALTADLCEALEQLESIQVAHNDVKPTNIVVGSDTGGGHRFVLVDYGLARVSAHTIDNSGIGGTPEYSAPERVLGYWGPAGDWYSVGVIVAECIQGRHPFAGGEGPALRLAAFTGQADLSGITDVRWRLLTDGLLTVDYRHRWGATQVRDWLNGETPSVHRPSGAPVAGTVTVTPLRFSGHEFRRDPRRLADALGSNWDDAARLLGSPAARQELRSWCTQFRDVDLLAALDPPDGDTVPLDRQVIAVIGALYSTPTDSDAGTHRCWYQGHQLTVGALRGLCAEALASAAELANHDPAALDIESTPALALMARLIGGDLDALARAAGGRGPIARLHRDLESGMAFVFANTTDLEPVRDPWEELLWSIELMSCLCGPNAAIALRDEARAVTVRRGDLAWLVTERTVAAHHLTATIRARRTPRRPRRSARIVPWFR